MRAAAAVVGDVARTDVAPGAAAQALRGARGVVLLAAPARAAATAAGAGAAERLLLRARRPRLLRAPVAAQARAAARLAPARLLPLPLRVAAGDAGAAL